MDGNMFWAQEIRLTIHQINSQGQDAIRKLQSYLTKYGFDAFIVEIQYLVEDLMGHPEDKSLAADLKKDYIGMLINHLHTKMPNGPLIIKTAFDTVDLPPGKQNSLQSFIETCEFSNDIMIWICICTSSCQKQAISQEATQLLHQFVPLIKDGGVKISPALFRDLNNWLAMMRQSHQNNSKDPELVLPTRLGRLLAELGPAATSSLDVLRSVLAIAKDANGSAPAPAGNTDNSSTSIQNLRGLLHMLMIVANKEGAAPTSPAALPQETKEDIQSIRKSFPDLRSPAGQTWDIAVLAAGIREVIPLDYDQLLFGLDASGISIENPLSLRFIISIAKELTGKTIPDELLYQPWKNLDHQVMFLQSLLECSDDLVDFSKSPNQITPPSFFTGEIQSCWTSLDLLDIILQLQAQSEQAMVLHRARVKTAVDVTVLMVALIQLKKPWTAVRYKLMNWTLLQKTMSVAKKPGQSLSLTSCMQLFFGTSPMETLECVLNTYYQSLDNRSTWSFFPILYEACYNINSFVMSLIKMQVTQKTLQLIVHVLYLEAVSANNLDALKRKFDDLCNIGEGHLLLLLLHLVDDYVQGQGVVITHPQVAAWTMQYLQGFINNMSLPFRQQYLELAQHFQTAPQRTSTTLLQSWISLKTIGERKQFIDDLVSISNSAEGVSILHDLIEKSLDYLDNAARLSQAEVASLVDLLAMMATNKLIDQSVLTELVRFILNGYSNPNAGVIKFAAVRMLDGITPLLQTIPRYLQSLLSNQIVQKIPVLHQQLALLYSQIAAVSPTMSKSPTEPDVTTPISEINIHSPIPKERLSQASNQLREKITSPIQPLHAEAIEAVPEDRVKNRISVLINNLTTANVDSKIDDLLALVTPEFETWFADYLVRSRCERQTNYHSLYLTLVDLIVRVRGAHLMDEMIRLSIQATRELLTCEQQLFMEQHSFLKNLGEWLGLLTIGRDVCLSQLHLNLTHELLIAFYHKRLIYVYEFVCFLLRAAKTSKVIRPPQPWLMALLSLLREINEVPGIQNKIGYFYSNYLSFMGFAPEDIILVDSDLYLAIPEVKNNPDFVERASQEEVVMYFMRRYPVMIEMNDETSLRSVVDQKKSFRDFVPRAMQSSSPVYTPTGPTGASGPSGPSGAAGPSGPSGPSGAAGPAATPVQDDVPLVVMPEEVRETLTAEQQSELRNLIESDIDFIVNSYKNTYGKMHYAAVLNSVFAMYERDLCQVKDTREVMDYMEKAAHALVGNQLVTIAPMMERDLLVCLHKHEVAYHLVTDLKLHLLVKRNVGPLLDLLRGWLITTTLKDLEELIQKDRMKGSSVCAEKAVDNTMADMTANERVEDGVLNSLQRGIFVNLPDAPAVSDHLLTDEELLDISATYRYQQVIALLQRLKEHQLQCSVIEVRQHEDERAITECLQKISTNLTALEGNHILEEDTRVVNFLISMIIAPEAANNLNIPSLVVRVGAVMTRSGLPQVKEKLTAVVLERLTPAVQERVKQTQFLSLPTLMACSNLLDIDQMDKKFQELLQNSLAGAMDYNRIVFSCLIDLVLVRELVRIDQIPRTMKALEEKAATDAGKRSIRIENTPYNCAVMVEKLQSKQAVMDQRAALQSTYSNDSIRDLTAALDVSIHKLIVSENVVIRATILDELISKIDAAVLSVGDNGAFITLFCLVLSCYQMYSPVTEPKEMTIRRDVICTLLCSVLAELVHREEPGDDRKLVFDAELNVIQALLLQSHDLNSPAFISTFFLRVLLGLLKQVVMEQPSVEQVHSMTLQFANALKSVSPADAPSFIISWLQLISTPQFLRLTLGEGVPELVQVMGDLIVKLLYFTKYLMNSGKEVLEVTQHLIERVTQLLAMILKSFPGCMIQRASEIITIVKEEVWAAVMYDCPLQCNLAIVAPEERDAVVQRAWNVQLEPNPQYRQELQRMGLLEAADSIAFGKCADVIMSIRQKLEIPVVMRLLTHYWVLEEESLRAKGQEAQLLSPAQAIMDVLKGVGYNRNCKHYFIKYLSDFMNFPCKESGLFMKAYCELYCHMEPETKNVMVDVMKRKEGINGQIMAYMTLQKLQG